VGPWQLFGIEINAYAHELAQMTVWIGYLQWLRQHGTTTWKEPVLQAMSNIECKDAILDLTDPDNPKEPDWPAVDFIVGNPPFLGGKLMRGDLSDAYVNRLRRLYSGRIPAFSDLVCYWFEKARRALTEGKARRCGLLATQGIRGGANRRVLERIKESGDIFWAESDRNWILNGAAVHVSMIGFDSGEDKERRLDGAAVALIHSNLSARSDTTKARALAGNAGRAFIGVQKSGTFDMPELEAVGFLRSPTVAGRPTSDVLRPYLTAHNLLRRSDIAWIADFSGKEEAEATRYDAIFERTVRVIEEERTAKHFRGYPHWIFWRPRPELMEAAMGLRRFLVTAHVSKHFVFSWIEPFSVPSNLLIVVATEAEADFGILQSKVHQSWALAQGTQLREKESGFRYTPTTCFETFPFPSMKASDEAAIAEAAAELDRLRRAWLNPAEWTKEEVLEFPGSVDGPWKRFVHEPDARGIGTVRWPRIVAKDDESAKKLAKRTLTNLYNERPAWLDLAHKKLDEAVFAAYGWPADLTDEQILERLLALNLERAAGQK
jgi:type II restriction/modification system DNA methylase subunit YeeA